MPRAYAARHELRQLSGSADDEVGGHAEPRERCVVRVRRGVERIQEQLVDRRSAKLARRQTDRVHDDELNARAGCAFVRVGGSEKTRAIDDAVIVDSHAQLLASSSSLMPSRSMR